MGSATCPQEHCVLGTRFDSFELCRVFRIFAEEPNLHKEKPGLFAHASFPLIALSGESFKDLETLTVVDWRSLSVPDTYASTARSVGRSFGTDCLSSCGSC